MARAAYFIRRRGDACSVIKIRSDGREEILEQGLTLAEAEALYFDCIGAPMHEASVPDTASDPVPTTGRRRPRQLAFKF